MAKAAQFDAEAFVGQRPDMTPAAALLTLPGDPRDSSLHPHKRSMILDQDVFEQRFLRCPVCHCHFSSGCLPRVLPCHHSFCQSCLESLLRAAREHISSFHSSLRGLSLSTPPGAVSLACPTCRATSLATLDTVRRLPADHRIVQLMDFVQHTDRYTVTFCSQHHSQPLNFFCEPCLLPVCRDCTVQLHQGSEAHQVMDLGDAMSKYTPVIDSTLTELEAEVLSLQEKTLVLEEVADHLDTVKSTLLSEIRSCMSRLRELLDSRENALVAKVHQETERERSKLQEKSSQLDRRRQVLMEKCRELQEAKETNSIQQMFLIHSQIRQFRTDPPPRVREIDEGLVTSFQVNTRDEPMLASRINNFGDVISKVETSSSRIKTKSKTGRSFWRY